MKTEWTLHEITACETAQEIAAAVVKATGEVMTRHGNDPHGACIVATGFALALDAMGEIVPVIPMITVELMKPESRERRKP